MPAIRVKVGASMDASFREVFRTIEEASKRTRKVIESNSKSSNDTMQAGYRTNAREAMMAEEEKARAAEKWSKYRARVVENSATMAGRVAKQQADEEIRQVARSAREIERLEKQKTVDRREMTERRSSNVSKAVTLGAMTSLYFGARVAGSALRGAGVDFDLGSNMQKNTELEKTSVTLSNMGYMPGQEGAAGQRQDPNAIMKDIKTAANTTGMSFEEASEGLSEFVGKTGELELGRSLLTDMGKLSKATGSNMKDMVSAAGDVSTALGDIPNKAEVIKGTMAAIAGQGKLGTMEIKNFASQMAKVAAQAPQITGDVATNIKTLGVFAQMARKGGAASASQQATSVQAMINTFKTPARIAAFKANKIDVFDAKTKMIRDPRQIMMDALAVAGNDPLKFKKMFGNVQGERAVAGFANTYKQAYNSKAMEGHSDSDRAAYAAQKVSDEFDELARSTMSQEEIDKSFGLAMQTTASKAQLLNNQLQETTGELMKDLTPALLDLVTALIPAAKAVSDFMGVLTGSKDKNSSQEITNASLGAGNVIEQEHGMLRSSKVTKAQLDAADKAQVIHEESAKKAKDVADEERKSAKWGMKGVAALLPGITVKEVTEGQEKMQQEKDAAAKNAATLAAESNRLLKMIHDKIDRKEITLVLPPDPAKVDTRGQTTSSTVPE